MALSLASQKGSITAPKWLSQITEIERLGLNYLEVSAFPLEKVDIEGRRIQVRETQHVAPKESVKRFAEQMSTTEFPPIVMTGDDFIADGNTRVAAARLRKVTFLPAFVLDPYESATPQVQKKIQALAATLNCQAGVALTVAERRKAVPGLLFLNWKVEQIRRALGLTTAVVSQVKKEVDAKAKLDKLGMEVNAEKEMILLRGLGAGTVIGLNDKPYHELALLSRDASLRIKEVADLAHKMREAGSDEAALEVVARKRREFHDRIIEHGLTGNGRPSNPSIMRQRLGYVIKFEGTEELLIERNPENVRNYLDVLSRSARVLEKVVALHDSGE
jgi:hypothetical protein